MEQAAIKPQTRSCVRREISSCFIFAILGGN